MHATPKETLPPPMHHIATAPHPSPRLRYPTRSETEPEADRNPQRGYRSSSKVGRRTGRKGERNDRTKGTQDRTRSGLSGMVLFGRTETGSSREPRPHSGQQVLTVPTELSCRSLGQWCPRLPRLLTGEIPNDPQRSAARIRSGLRTRGLHICDDFLSPVCIPALFLTIRLFDRQNPTSPVALDQSMEPSETIAA